MVYPHIDHCHRTCPLAKRLRNNGGLCGMVYIDPDVHSVKEYGPLMRDDHLRDAAGT